MPSPCHRTSNIDSFLQALATVTLPPEKRIYMEERYIRILHVAHDRSKRMTLYFNLNRTIITIGSIIVPALLSIQHFDVSLQVLSQIGIYWTTWVLSLMVTISNGLVTLYKLDKKFYLLHTSYEQMKSEGWQYIALTGHYKYPPSAGEANTHETQFRHFTQTVERIHMRQMEEEYIKLQDVSGPKSGQPSQGSSEIPTLMDYQGKTPLQGEFLAKIIQAVRTEVQRRPENSSVPPVEGTQSSDEDSQTQEIDASSRNVISRNGGGESMPV